jgi:hypothetical protein
MPVTFGPSYIYTMIHIMCQYFSNIQVKNFLDEKKVATLVDPDLNGNYIDNEVDRLIQVALLCTHDSPSERPKMSEVVRLLEGDGVYGEQYNNAYRLRSEWLTYDSLENLRPDKLSGPS